MHKIALVQKIRNKRALEKAEEKDIDAETHLFAHSISHTM